MEYRTLGNTGMEVSLLSVGAWPMGDPRYWGRAPEADAETAIHTALDAGVTLFDTAESYGEGESERILGRLLRPHRSRVLIATKVSAAHCAPARLRAACEASLARLGTSFIDLYQIHWPFHDPPFEAAAEILLTLKAEGKIRAIGVSNFGCRDLESWLAAAPCASNQLGYNIAFRAIEHEIMPACLRHNIPVLAYMPLAQGILTGRWKTPEDIPQARRRTRHFSGTRAGVRHGEAGCENLLFQTLGQLEALAAEIGCTPAALSLAWLREQTAVASIIVGARNPAQLRQNSKALTLPLDANTLGRLETITAPLKKALGTNPDMWCGAAQSRIQ